MKNQFTDIYEFLGVPKDGDQQVINDRCDEVIKQCRKLQSSGNIDDSEMKAVEKSVEILTDKEERETYDELGHEVYMERRGDYLQNIQFIGGSDMYSDLYALFGISPSIEQSDLKRETATKMKNSHPDADDEEAVDIEQFNTIKKARNILTDEEKREKYDKLGHNRYVKEEFDGELRGFAFTGRGSIIDSVEQKDSIEDKDIEDLMSFKPNAERTDPTKKATNKDSVSSANKNLSDENDIADVAKKRSKITNKKSSKSSKKSSSKSSTGGSTGGGLLSFLTSTKFMLLLLTVVLFAVILWLYLSYANA